MDYANYSTEGSSVPRGIKSNGLYSTYGCSQSDVYDWLSDIVMPPDYTVCNIIEIEFKGSRKEFYLNHKNIYFKNGELAVVETTMGYYDVGHVSLTGELVRMQLRKKNVRVDEVVKKIYRRATSDDEIKWKLAKGMELDTLHKARVLAKALDLSMKLTDVDYQGDKSKATFYYTAEGRVDYRELIKHLSGAFHIRVEMRQIGLREETIRIGTIGPCGSYYCCRTWPGNLKKGVAWDDLFLNKKKKKNKKNDNIYECYIDDERDKIQLDNSDTIKNNISRVDKIFYQNVINQDSITRFDDKETNRKKKNYKKKNRKP